MTKSWTPLCPLRVRPDTADALRAEAARQGITITAARRQAIAQWIAQMARMRREDRMSKNTQPTSEITEKLDDLLGEDWSNNDGIANHDAADLIAELENRMRLGSSSARIYLMGRHMQPVDQVRDGTGRRGQQEQDHRSTSHAPAPATAPTTTAR